MTDKEIIERIFRSDAHIIKEFFCIRCKPMLIYITKNIYDTVQ